MSLPFGELSGYASVVLTYCSMMAKSRRPPSSDHREDGEPAIARAAAEAGRAPQRSGRSVLLKPGQIGALQQMVGNAAVQRMVTRADRNDRTTATPVLQRDFDDQGPASEGQLGADGPVSQPDLGEGGGGGGDLIADVNENGDYDGKLTTASEVHVFMNKGQVATGKWHHTGGTGGKGNENTGTSTVVAPVFESSPAPPKGGTAKAWVKKGTGKVTVPRSWNGVTAGDNGTALWAGSGGGLVFIMWSAVARMGQHEAGHVKETKKIHDAEITPMEQRIKQQKTGATEADAVTAMQTHVNWNATLASFVSKDTAMNAAGATFDTTDSAKANFYHDKGKKKIKKVQYDHFIEAP